MFFSALFGIIWYVFYGIFSLFVGGFVYSLRRRGMAEGNEAATDPRLEAISNYCCNTLKVSVHIIVKAGSTGYL